MSMFHLASAVFYLSCLFPQCNILRNSWNESLFLHPSGVGHDQPGVLSQRKHVQVRDRSDEAQSSFLFNKHLNCPHDKILLFSRKLRKHRKGKHLLACSLRRGEGSLIVPQPFEALLEM